MLLLLSLTFILLITVVFIFLFARRYTVVRINGESMLPTLKDGQIRIIDRKFITENLHAISSPYSSEQYIGRIFVVQTPTGVPAIKRLIYISHNMMGTDFWFEGDNKENSEDSRNYGFLRSGDIIGELVDFNTFWKRIFVF